MLLRLSLLLKILVVSSAVIKAVNDEIKRFLKQTYLHYFQKKKKKGPRLWLHQILKKISITFLFFINFFNLSLSILADTYSFLVLEDM